MSTVINQKEYLRKYLGVGKKLKDKKKKKKIVTQKVKIIDDDLDSTTLSHVIEEDPFQANEDAPQIVAIIDERPPSLRIDEKTNSSLWKPIGPATDGEIVVARRGADSDKSTGVSFNVAKSKQQNESKRQSDSSDRKSRRQNDTTPDSRIVDSSPPRRKKATDSCDNSPPRKIKRKSLNEDCSPPARSIDTNTDNSPPRRKRGDDSSPPRKKKNRNIANNSEAKRSKRWDSSPPRKTTLDGKIAGLQNAKELIIETRALQEREEELFRNMPKQFSGKNAETILRDRKTGKVRDLEQEAAVKLLKHEQEQKRKEKYSKWGKGLAQIEQRNRQHEYEAEEMNKPLARYANDADLENYLKQQDREGDPMLAYIKSKRRKEAVERNETVKPEYMGEFMPNRFGIRPGHRWDGVDRSNGYEQRWFEVLNSKKAQEEESYKWSTEDM